MAFLKKVKQDESDLLTPEQMRDLAERDINGRQIKNIVKTASALAKSQQQTVNYPHLKEVLDIMMQFEARYVCASCLFNKGLDDYRTETMFAAPLLPPYAGGDYSFHSKFDARGARART